jgi:hypothetical protein
VERSFQQVSDEPQDVLNNNLKNADKELFLLYFLKQTHYLELLKLLFCHENVLLNLSYFRYASAWNVREKESGPVYGMEWDRALIEILARFNVF